jgi:hypothetical protein
LSIKDLADGQGELMISLEYNPMTEKVALRAYMPLPQDTKPANIAAAYLSLCDSDNPRLCTFFHSNSHKTDCSNLKTCPESQIHTILNTQTPLAIFAGKKYKPVGQKIRPVETELPSRFHITCNIKGNPLQNLLTLQT